MKSNSLHMLNLEIKNCSATPCERATMKRLLDTVVEEFHAELVELAEIELAEAEIKAEVQKIIDEGESSLDEVFVESEMDLVVEAAYESMAESESSVRRKTSNFVAASEDVIKSSKEAKLASEVIKRSDEKLLDEAFEDMMGEAHKVVKGPDSGKLGAKNDD